MNLVKHEILYCLCEMNTWTALEAAAVASRLPHDKMTREEVNLFQDILDKTLTPKHIEKYKMFIYIRNKIVSHTSSV